MLINNVWRKIACSKHQHCTIENPKPLPRREGEGRFFYVSILFYFSERFGINVLLLCIFCLRLGYSVFERKSIFGMLKSCRDTFGMGKTGATNILKNAKVIQKE